MSTLFLWHIINHRAVPTKIKITIVFTMKLIIKCEIRINCLTKWIIIKTKIYHRRIVAIKLRQIIKEPPSIQINKQRKPLNNHNFVECSKTESKLKRGMKKQKSPYNYRKKKYLWKENNDSNSLIALNRKLCTRVTHQPHILLGICRARE